MTCLFICFAQFSTKKLLSLFFTDIYNTGMYVCVLQMKEMVPLIFVHTHFSHLVSYILIGLLQFLLSDYMYVHQKYCYVECTRTTY